MHATLFAPNGTRAACLGFGNLVQSVIGAPRGHEMAYLTKGFDITGIYSSDEGELTRVLEAVRDGSTRPGQPAKPQSN